MSSYEISLRHELDRRKDQLSKKLIGKIDNIEEIAKKLLIYTHSKFPYYTPHDFTHSLNVEENLNWIVLDKIKEELHSYEIFFLIMGAWFHDIGMIGFEQEDPTEVRRNHHLRSEEVINEKYEELFLNEEEAIILGKICRGHRSEDLNSSDYDPTPIGQGIMIDLRFLTALVRIADEFDITANRVPEIIYFKLNPSSTASEEFKKHLQIIGIAPVSQKQRYKVIISAIAKNPKGAKTMEKLREKVQETLNSVKNFLALNGIMLEVIDLNLTTRGFIYKPIKFELNEEKILDILMGEHLYKSKDVAIRELIQNSIDACLYKKIFYPKNEYKIEIRKISDKLLEIEDNGIGMDFRTAKDFLSFIGDSLYYTDDLKELIKTNLIDPFARFGIGFLSSFLISKKVILETKKEEYEPCKFTIETSQDLWKYEKGSLRESGTKIILELKDDFIIHNLKKVIEKYITETEIPIYFSDNGGEMIKYEQEWNFKNITTNFLHKQNVFEEIYYQELLNFENESFKVIFGLSNHYPEKNLVLFNHGVFVGSFDPKIPAHECIICVSSKKNLYDLKISREDVEYNEHWKNFLENIFNDIFDKFVEMYLPDHKKDYFECVQDMLDYRHHYKFNNQKEFSEFLEENPFFISFFKKVYYPLVKESMVKLILLGELRNYTELNIYKSRISDSLFELSLIEKYLNKEQIYLYDLYKLDIKIFDNDQNKYLDYFYQFLPNILNFNTFCIIDIILENLIPVENHLDKITDDTIEFAKFPEDLNAVILIKEKAKVKTKHLTHGRAYWGNLLLFKSLISTSRLNEMFQNLPSEKRHYVEYLEVISEPIVYINMNDKFIQNLFNLREEIFSKAKIKEMVFRYLKYISFLPYILVNISSLIYYFEIIDYLEIEISQSLEIEKPEPILKRMGKIGKIILDYYWYPSSDLYEEIGKAM